LNNLLFALSTPLGDRVEGAGGRGNERDRGIGGGVARRRQVGIPSTVVELGLGRSEFDAVARLAATDICAGTNPVAVDAESLRVILEAAA